LLVDWTGADEDQGDVNVWEDNWDDDNVEDDFSQQLRSEQHFCCHISNQIKSFISDNTVHIKSKKEWIQGGQTGV